MKKLRNILEEKHLQTHNLDENPTIPDLTIFKLISFIILVFIFWMSFELQQKIRQNAMEMR